MNKLKEYLQNRSFEVHDEESIRGSGLEYSDTKKHLPSFEVNAIIEFIKESKEVKAYVLDNLTFEERLEMSNEQDLY